MKIKRNKAGELIITTESFRYLLDEWPACGAEILSGYKPFTATRKDGTKLKCRAVLSIEAVDQIK